jgi:hypothetical protein
VAVVVNGICILPRKNSVEMRSVVDMLQRKITKLRRRLVRRSSSTSTS